jgi:hypothetical protein
MTEHQMDVEVIHQIKEGFGYEDIAVRMGVPAEYTQSIMRRLADLGVYSQPKFFTKMKAALS